MAVKDGYLCRSLPMVRFMFLVLILLYKGLPKCKGEVKRILL